MAGSAINLGISGGLFGPVGLGQNQQALLSQLQQRAANLGRPAPNLEDPNVLREEARKRQAAGDVGGALEMLGRARQLETA